MSQNENENFTNPRPDKKLNQGECSKAKHGVESAHDNEPEFFGQFTEFSHEERHTSS